MAFFRVIRVKGNPYLYLVRCVREGRRVRQRILKYYGRADREAYREAQTDAERLRARAQS